MLRGIDARKLRLDAWQVIRSRETFTSEDLVGAGMSGHSARTLLRKLQETGVVQRVTGYAGNDRSAACYQLAGPKARVPRAVDETYYWQCQAWQTMRIKRRFTASEVLRAMEDGIAGRRALSRWFKALTQEGYLRCASAIVAGQETVYQLVRENGPEPPHVLVSHADGVREGADD